MSDNHHFRKAFKGFHREDVVHYIEYLNGKHAGEINKMKSEIQALKDELEALHTKELTVDTAVLEDVTAQRDEALAQVAELQVQLEMANANAKTSATTLAEAELEAYRRAERMERIAKERADEIYRKATATLADATTQLETALGQVDNIVDAVNEQLNQLHAAAEDGRAALKDAVDTMYAIRPDVTEE